jgi:NifB/MoaA-like Fe-S oxidoreductase
LTGHREGLYPLELQSREDAADTVARVEAAGQEALKAHGRRIVFASDELYLAAGLPIPDYDYYEDFPQLENGIGMIAMLREEVMGALPGLVPPQRSRKVTAVTGESVFPYLRVLVDEIENKCNNNLSVNLIPIRNDFFGGGINVTGLVTGGDIVKQLGGKPLGEALIVPAVMLRYDRVCFLDDMTVEQLSQELDIPIVIAEMSGEGLIESMTGQPLGGV